MVLLPLKSTCRISGKLSGVASFHAPEVAQLRTPSIATLAPASSDDPVANPPLAAKATFVLPDAGVGVVTGVGNGV